LSLSHEERTARRYDIAEYVKEHGLFKAMKKFQVCRQTVEGACAEHEVSIKEIISHAERKKKREAAEMQMAQMQAQQAAQMAAVQAQAQGNIDAQMVKEEGANQRKAADVELEGAKMGMQMAQNAAQDTGQR
jgi:hypothetical protein